MAFTGACGLLPRMPILTQLRTTHNLQMSTLTTIPAARVLYFWRLIKTRLAGLSFWLSLRSFIYFSSFSLHVSHFPSLLLPLPCAEPLGNAVVSAPTSPFLSSRRSSATLMLARNVLNQLSMLLLMEQLLRTMVTWFRVFSSLNAFYIASWTAACVLLHKYPPIFSS